VSLVSAVRFGRVPKREKARILAAMQQSSNSRSQEKAVAAELEDEQRLLSTVIRAHLDTCDFTRDKVEPMLARARDQPSYTACPPTLVSYTLAAYLTVIPSQSKSRELYWSVIVVLGMTSEFHAPVLCPCSLTEFDFVSLFGKKHHVARLYLEIVNLYFDQNVLRASM
jgi:hypothetical protein